MTPAADGLRALLPALADPGFFREDWGRRHRVLRTSAPARLIAALDPVALAALLRDGRLDVLGDELKIVRAGQPFPAAELTAAGLDLARLSPGDEQRVLACFSQGHSLVFRLAERCPAGLDDLCRLFAEAFGCRVYPALYLSPAAAQGFPVHLDQDEIFVLQLRGHKRWRLYHGQDPAPDRPRVLATNERERLPLVAEETLGPGDVLYLPRGMPHEALAIGGVSAHLSISLELPRQWNALLASLDACRDSVLDEPLPPVCWQDPGVIEALRSRVFPQLQAAFASLTAVPVEGAASSPALGDTARRLGLAPLDEEAT